MAHDVEKIDMDPSKMMERDISPLELPPWPNPIPAILVEADKGGTGKSSISVNLALELQKMGLKVGIVDGDVDSPNIGEMLGLFDAMHIRDDDKHFVPLMWRGIRVSSSSFFVDRNKRTSFAMSNCGKDNQQAVSTLIRCAEWGDTEVLVVDCPAGTSDELNAVLASVMLENIIGSVVVINPANRFDLERVFEVAFRHQTRILGVIENKKGMVSKHGSKVICGCGCGEEVNVYGIPAGQESIAQFCGRNQLIYLGFIPLIEEYTQRVLMHDPEIPAKLRAPITMVAGMIRAVKHFMSKGRTAEADDRVGEFLMQILSTQGVKI